MINYEEEVLSSWDLYEILKSITNENSKVLDLGTGGGEKVLKYYPNVRKIYATDFSKEMIKTAKENAKKYSEKNIEFLEMDNLNMNFPSETFDLISAANETFAVKVSLRLAINSFCTFESYNSLTDAMK